MKPLIRKYSPLATIFVAFALVGSESAHAVNAAWNTDASSGNFNTAQWSINTVPVAGGTYTVVSGDALFFGTSTTTTLTNDLVGATYNGLTFNSGASAFTIGGNSFTLNGNITNNSTSLQTINNDMTSTGRVFAGGAGGLTLGGTHTVTTAATYNGIVTLKGATTINGGATSNAGFATVGNNTSATVTISDGGSLTVNGTTNANKPGTIIGQNTLGVGILNVGATNGSTSGTLTVSGDTGFILGNLGAGTLNIYSGTATINRGTTATTTNTADTRMIMLGRDSNSATGTINLNGGILATDRQFVRDGSSSAGAGTANFVFNGGTLKALAAQTDWLQSTTATIQGQNNGSGSGTLNTNALALSSVTTTATSTIDSNGFAVAINNNISGAGGFNIISTTPGGTVTLGGTSTYSGGTTVLSGNLATDLVGNFGLGNVTVADSITAALTLGNANSIADTAFLFFGDDSTITLNNSTTETLAGITQTDDSQSIGAGTYTAAELNGIFGVDSFLGEGTLTVVPEPTAALLGSVGLLGLLRRRRVA